MAAGAISTIEGQQEACRRLPPGLLALILRAWRENVQICLSAAHEKCAAIGQIMRQIGAPRPVSQPSR
ncbi:hypothetical protein, partial [Streptococcus pneumoniae]|uniref:hypothetical protein n=1 Tax=Streptococcus pneumoniae TaxID=1313 RepID=UPI001952C303